MQHAARTFLVENPDLGDDLDMRPVWDEQSTTKAKASPSKRQKSQTSPGLAKTLMSSTSASTSQDIYGESMPCTVSPGMARKPCRRRLLHRPQSPSAAATAPIMSSLHMCLRRRPRPQRRLPDRRARMMLQYFCKASCKYITQMKDGTSKRHPVFTGTWSLAPASTRSAPFAWTAGEEYEPQSRVQRAQAE